MYAYGTNVINKRRLTLKEAQWMKRVFNDMDEISCIQMCIQNVRIQYYAYVKIYPYTDTYFLFLLSFIESPSSMK